MACYEYRGNKKLHEKREVRDPSTPCLTQDVYGRFHPNCWAHCRSHAQPTFSKNSLVSVGGRPSSSISKDFSRVFGSLAL